MPFSEKIKIEVKRKSAFQCCRCHEIGIDVHHIVSQEQKGSDDISNAAPLCQNCHDRYGDNSKKQKEIRQMRDFWYAVVQEKYPTGNNKYEVINDLILSIQKTQSDHTSEISELKELLKKNDSEVTDPINSQNVQSITNDYVTATTLASGVHANFQCQKCNTHIGLLVGSDKCPTCGEPI